MVIQWSILTVSIPLNRLELINSKVLLFGIVLLVVVLALLLGYWTLNNWTRKKLITIAWMGLALVSIVILATWMIKIPWGRVRFREMVAPF